MEPTPTIREVVENGERAVVILDQTRLPHEVVLRRLATLEEAAQAIATMQVRGAPLIGVTAAYGVALGLATEAADTHLEWVLATLEATRPTAVNLQWALRRMEALLKKSALATRREAAWREARAIADEDATANAAIGRHGLSLIARIREEKPRSNFSLRQEGLTSSPPPPGGGHRRDSAKHCFAPPKPAGCAKPAVDGREGVRTCDDIDVVNVMTHCNAGRLATVAHGTALAPIYAAHAAGMPLHVWVSETRPRNQGLLTAWELAEAGVPYTLIADNAAGFLLMQGRVDAVIVGADRIAANGDVVNKIGTYLKALAAHAHGVPFYVAAPLSTLDFDCAEGAAVPIEERAAAEFGEAAKTMAQIANPAFDVTPAALITAIISERGIASPKDIGAWKS